MKKQEYTDRGNLAKLRCAANILIDVDGNEFKTQSMISDLYEIVVQLEKRIKIDDSK